MHGSKVSWASRQARGEINSFSPMSLSLSFFYSLHSVKFATMMHDAVQTYLESSGIASFNIQAIALEGQGQVEDRVNKLYSQLRDREEWVQALEKADVVFLATHSQGTVVSTQLLARMLDQNLIAGTQTHLYAPAPLIPLARPAHLE